MARALTLLALVFGPAVARAQPRLVLHPAEDSPTLAAPLLLAFQLEFPEAEVVLGGAEPQPHAIATIWLRRSGEAYRIRVLEAGARVAVERDLPVAATDDDSAVANAAALLARALLGVALLYEPERTSRSPVLAKIAKAPAVRAARALAPAEITPRRARSAPLLLAAGAVARGPLAGRLARFGARASIGLRLGSTPLEAAAEVSVLTSVERSRGELTLLYRGIPLGAWVRWKLPAGPVDLRPGLGIDVERSEVTAVTAGAGRRRFADWNAAPGLEVRAAVTLAGALALEGGARLAARLGDQQYRYQGALVLDAPGLGWAVDLGVVAALP